MRFFNLILSFIAAFASTALGSALGWCAGGSPIFDIYHLVYFFKEDNINGPCEKMVTDDKETCYALAPGSLPAQAVKVNVPAGLWDCYLFHTQDCTGEEHTLYMNGRVLPPEWSGKLGSFYCKREPRNT